MTYRINGVKTTKEEFLRIAREAQRLNVPKFTYIAQTLSNGNIK
jgi:hypothetical protein